MTRDQIELMSQIADRGIKLLSEHGITQHKLTAMMDLEHAHIDVPMDLQQFLEFEDSDFNHDYLGIRRHMDRLAGKLTDCFVPRCAL